MFRKHQKECETKLGEPKDMIQKMLKGEDLGDMEKAGKMALCVNMAIGHMNENGELIPDKFKEHVDNLMENMVENMRKRIRDECGKKHEFQVLKRSQIECEKLLVEPKNLLENLVGGKDLGDLEKAGKMALCINVRLGHMKEDGEIISDKYKVHVEKLTADENERKAILEQCGHKNGKNPAEAALNYGYCMKKNLPTLKPIHFQLDDTISLL
ncbi:unnamed protein product [Phyllotreta striolata]|uniref:Uncharacterized protein n=1 Tax=Phyllotreta striolata TaxID=444603 RepID=A0A9N9TWP6_PHYSR|nr:unnamed protein product [Phyllotreta striolata]